MKKSFIIISILLFLITGLSAQVLISNQAATSEIKDLVVVPGSEDEEGNFQYFSASKDGFLIKWNQDGSGEHYQISDLGVSQTAISPDGKYIAVVETDGGSVYKVSVWDWKTLTKVFNKKYDGTVNTIKFSSQGTYLIIGSSTYEALEFVDTNNWKIKENVIQSTMMASFIFTTDTEKSMVCYAPSGNLSYFSIDKGKLKLKLNIQAGLSQVVLYNKANYIAGVYENNIYIFNSTDGKLIKQLSCLDPVLVTDSSDTNLYFIDVDSKGKYSLKISNSTEVADKKDPKKMIKSASSAKLLSPIIFPKGISKISKVIKKDNYYLAGTKSGLIYKAITSDEKTNITFEQLPAQQNNQIKYISKFNDNFYALTKSGLYKLPTSSELVPEKIYDTAGKDSFIMIDENTVIIPPKELKSSLTKMDLTTKVKTPLFTPKSLLSVVKFFDYEDNKYLVTIENRDSVYVYDFTKKSYKLIYSGAGLEDVVLTKDKQLFISKSNSTTPRTPLIKVDMKTKETSPTPVAGYVAFNLSTDGTLVYGVSLVNEDDNKNTYIFCYNPQEKQAYNVIKFNEEHSNAFIYLSDDTLFTNIGKDCIYCYNFEGKEKYTVSRGVSLPLNMVKTNGYILILNKDGSLSLIEDGEKKVSNNYYFTSNNEFQKY